MRVIRNAFACVVLTVAAVGCASAPPAADDSGAPADANVIVVENQLTSFSDVVVYIEPQSGVRASLGRVESGTTGTFTYNGLGAFTLIAQPTTGSTITSERFSMQAPSRARWVLNSNRLSVTRR